MAPTAGSCLGIAFTVGILLSSLVTLISPEGKDLIDAENKNAAAIRMHMINCSVPIVIAVIQGLLMYFVYKYESPVVLKQEKKDKELKKALELLYKKEVV